MIAVLELILIGTCLTFAAVTDIVLYNSIANARQLRSISQYKPLVSDNNDKENIAVVKTKTAIKRATDFVTHGQNATNISTTGQLRRKNANKNLLGSFQANKETKLVDIEGFRRLLPYDVICNAVGTQCL